MTLFDDYSKNGELLQTREEILTEATFPRYLKQYGEHRAKAYYDTLREIIARTTVMLAPYEPYDKKEYGGWHPDHKTKVNATTYPFNQELQAAMKIAEIKFAEEPLPQPLTTYATEHLTGVRDALSDALKDFFFIRHNPATFNGPRRETYWELDQYHNNKKTFLRFIKAALKKNDAISLTRQI